MSQAAPSKLDSLENLDLSEKDFERVSQRIHKSAGIVLEPRKKQMIYSRLLRRLRALDIATFTEYLDMLETRAGEAEHQAFVNAITTNLTSFFREKHHFEHLNKHVLAPRSGPGQTRLRIWSAGCSTGEEPYTIALSIAAAINPVPSDFKILATDIDTNVLTKSRQGLYQPKDATNLSRQYSSLLSHDSATGNVQMGNALKKLISFRQLNLIGHWPMQGLFDVIFCRNVLIYFSPETKAQILEGFVDKLEPGGFLYLGHSEPILTEHPKLLALGQTMYQRRD